MTAPKESSDELNSAVDVSAAKIPTLKSRRTFGDYVALAIATCGVGYFPIAPGTLGALVGVAIYLPLLSLVPRAVMSRGVFVVPIDTPWLTMRLMAIGIVTMIGIWAGSRAERVLHKKDPSMVVIDEVAGQMIAMLSIPAFLPGWWAVLSAFLLFRLFDIWKPYPIRRLEGLESGLGIMADDVLAGIYALIANSIFITGCVFVMTRRA